MKFMRAASTIVNIDDIKSIECRAELNIRIHFISGGTVVFEFEDKEDRDRIFDSMWKGMKEN